MQQATAVTEMRDAAARQPLAAMAAASFAAQEPLAATAGARSAAQVALVLTAFPYPAARDRLAVTPCQYPAAREPLAATAGARSAARESLDAAAGARSAARETLAAAAGACPAAAWPPVTSAASAARAIPPTAGELDRVTACDSVLAQHRIVVPGSSSGRCGTGPNGCAGRLTERPLRATLYKSLQSKRTGRSNSLTSRVASGVGWVENRRVRLPTR